MIKWNDLVSSIKNQLTWNALIQDLHTTYGVPRRALIQLITRLSPHYCQGSPPSFHERKRLLKAISWLQQGHPIDYLLGEIVFYNRSFYIQRGVLLPRVETEWLVDLACQFIRQYPIDTVIELGAGSGVIGLSLALENPHIQVAAWDISQRAIALTKQNHTRHPCSNFQCLLGSFFHPQTGYGQVCTPNTLIVSNPPYIPTHDLPHLSDSVQQLDPKQALDGKQDGLFFYKKLIAIANRHQLPLLCEIGFNQGDAIRHLATSIPFMLDIKPDLAGHDRFAILIPKNSNLT